MTIKGKILHTADSPNIHSCGPKIVSEVVRLCLEHVPRELKARGQLTAYDPFCGNGVFPSVISSDWKENFSRIFASDVDLEAVDTTKENLRRQISELKISPMGVERGTPPSFVFLHNIHEPIPSAVPDGSVKVAFADPPYCEDCGCVDANGQTVWKAADRTELMNSLFLHLAPKMAKGSVVGIVTCTRMRIGNTSEAFRYVENHRLHGAHQTSQRSLHILEKSS